MLFHNIGLGLGFGSGIGFCLFGIAFILDMTTVFFAGTSAQFCAVDKLVALYTVALLSFLPNVLYARVQQRRTGPEHDDDDTLLCDLLKAGDAPGHGGQPGGGVSGGNRGRVGNHA